MRRVIAHLQGRPEDERQFVAMVGAVGVVVVLLLGWGVATMGVFTPARASQTAAAAQAGSTTADKTQTQQTDSVQTTIQDIQKTYEAEVQKMKEIQQGNGQ